MMIIIKSIDLRSVLHFPSTQSACFWSPVLGWSIGCWSYNGYAHDHDDLDFADVDGDVSDIDDEVGDDVGNVGDYVADVDGDVGDDNLTCSQHRSHKSGDQSQVHNSPI